ncbi:MAG: chromosomal replication initiator protein DnaA [Nitrospirae bacterium]|nr:chromosomal replication initiator protein DnaA [Nitrospirota bacterium]
MLEHISSNLQSAKLWDEALRIIEKKLNKQVFDTWFRRVNFNSFTDGILLLEVPSKFFRDWLKEHYLALITDTLSSLANAEVKVTFSIAPSPAESFRERPAKPQSLSPNEIYLNSRYTFDNFVVGESNHIAHAASLAVAESPAKAYNPLFVYGGVGLGKTHLMQAIGHFLRGKRPEAKISYISTETFVNHWIDSIRKQTTESFRNRYRTVDILLVDDIQFLAGKETTQEQFFHTFNALHDTHKQIVISSDRAPKEIPTLQERLVSRFEWGLVVDIQPPTLETRVAILKNKEVNLPEEVAFFIADRIQANIRELEGALIRVVAHASLTGTQITLSLAREVLKDIVPERERQTRMSIELIQKEVADFYGLRPSDMQAKKRSKMVAFPRQIAMFLARELTDNSLPEIGEAFGGRDHTTVMYACEKIENNLKEDASLVRAINQIKKKIGQ